MTVVQLELPWLIEPGATTIAHVSAATMANPKLLYAPEDLTEFTAELEHAQSLLPNRIQIDPERVERGLSTLVLTVIELLRQLMERQALRRMEAGTIDDQQIERLGQTFIKLEQRMEELKVIFDLTDEDLNLDLGPLGKLM